MHVAEYKIDDSEGRFSVTFNFNTSGMPTQVALENHGVDCLDKFTVTVFSVRGEQSLLCGFRQAEISNTHVRRHVKRLKNLLISVGEERRYAVNDSVESKNVISSRHMDEIDDIYHSLSKGISSLRKKTTPASTRSIGPQPDAEKTETTMSIPTPESSTSHQLDYIAAGPVRHSSNTPVQDQLQDGQEKQAQSGGNVAVEQPKRRIQVGVKSSRIAIRKSRERDNVESSTEPEYDSVGKYRIYQSKYASGSSIELNYPSFANKQVRMFIPDSAKKELAREAARSLQRDVEVAGFLMGHVDTVENEDGTEYAEVVVTDVLEINSGNAGHAHVAISEEAFRWLNNQEDKVFKPQGKQRLGWYHTHPSQGLFFSDRDLDAHSIWSQWFQVGLVLCPQQMRGVAFFWKEHNKELDQTSEFDLSERHSDPVPSRPQKASLLKKIFGTGSAGDTRNRVIVPAHTESSASLSTNSARPDPKHQVGNSDAKLRTQNRLACNTSARNQRQGPPITITRPRRSSSVPPKHSYDGPLGNVDRQRSPDREYSHVRQAASSEAFEEMPFEVDQGGFDQRPRKSVIEKAREIQFGGEFSKLFWVCILLICIFVLAVAAVFDDFEGDSFNRQRSRQPPLQQPSASENFLKNHPNRQNDYGGQGDASRYQESSGRQRNLTHQQNSGSHGKPANQR